MSTIYTNNDNLLGHGPNQSFGNHLLHLYAVYSLSEKRNIDFAISCTSNLDELLDTNKYKKEKPSDCVLLIDELWGGSLEELLQKDKNNLEILNKYCYTNISLPENFEIRGWFWFNSLAPKINIFDKLTIKKDLISFINSNYNFIFNDNIGVMHYRGTDFKNHSIGFGDVTVTIQYYIDSINKFKSKGINKFILISDDPFAILNELKKHETNIEVISNNYIIDWLILFYCKNLICSNSTFCWTAGLFNKESVIQPKRFFLNNKNINITYPIDPYYYNSIII